MAPLGAGRVTVRRVASRELRDTAIVEIRALLDAAFGPDDDERFTEDDWQHALGGTHFIAELDGAIVAHAAVVERELHVHGRPVRTGYVEAVATAPAHQGRGVGTSLMQDVNAYIGESFELGALGTGSHHFYERLGWQTWRGSAFVRKPDGLRRTPDEEGYILVLLTPEAPPIDLDAAISCEWRIGDVW